jgi:peptidoglycan hydrolase-like protein with peptidoglycan-binding domain
MALRKLASVGLCAVLAFGPAQRAAADGDVAAGLIGGIIGGMLGGAMQQQAQPQKTVKRSSGISSAQREQNRQVQEALNFFGFPVGTPDGALGPRSQAAIAQYQMFMGTPASGRLNDFEREFLTGAYYRAQAGGPDIQRELARNPDGMKGLLIVFRDEAAGGGTRLASAASGMPPEVADSVDEIAANTDVAADQLMQRSGFIQLADMNGDGRTDYLIDTSVSGSAYWCNAQSCTVRVFVSTPGGYQRNDFQAYNATPAMFSCLQGSCTLNSAPGTTLATAATGTLPQVQDTTTAAAAAPTPAVPAAQPVVSTPDAPAAAPALPTFMDQAPVQTAQIELASRCNKIQLTTTQNGGFTTADTLTDANFALSEQFCLLRSIAMAKSDEAMTQVQGYTPQQIADQCKSFGPALKPLVAGIAFEPRDASLQKAAAFIQSTGMPPAQISGIAATCLGVGYTVNDMDVAVGSAIILTATGQLGYGELVGHHLGMGFGTAARPDLAYDWYELGLSAPVPAFETNIPNRDAVVRKAAMSLGGRAAAPETTPAEGALPTFKVVSANP